jgi:hypothetical protein
MPSFSDTIKRATDIILKLTNDTLIYEDEQDYVNLKFDWYYVRKD